jgi:hypothetical protein
MYIMDTKAIKRRCPNGTRRNKKTDTCVKPTTKRRRCPNGTRRNKKTDTCVKPTTKRRRCPNGTRRNKKTDTCETRGEPPPPPLPPRSPHKTAVSKTITTLVQNTPVISVNPAKTIQDLETNVKTAITKHIDTVKPAPTPHIITTPGTYLPTASKITPHYNTPLPILVDVAECKSKNQTARDVVLYVGENVKKIRKDYPKVRPGCYLWSSKTAKKIALYNLKSTKKISSSQIIGPSQYLSNCWFNTFFMAFFISDRGRDFFRAVRKLMIEPNPGTPKKMKPGLFLFEFVNRCLFNGKYL